MSNPRNIGQILPQWMQAANEQDEGREYELERYDNLAPEKMPDARITSRLVRGHNVIVNLQEADDYSLMQYMSRQPLNQH